MASWFSDRCLFSKLVEPQPQSGADIYCLILSFPAPINQLTIYYKRFVKVDEQANVFKIIYTSRGLEKYKPPASVTKMLSDAKIRISPESSHRANFSQFGIVIRQVNMTEAD